MRGKDCLDTSKAQSMKEQTDELDFIKIKMFCSSKDDVKKMRSHRLGVHSSKWYKWFKKNFYPEYIKILKI